ncbi:MAG: cytochrome c biogenesis protein CcsA, partial [Verrucomicrobia bacterium]|nr:cytochrome c biogenesis protein CcsA [Deltaproteobacteria bacterium]
MSWIPWLAVICLIGGSRWRAGLLFGTLAELIYVGGRGLGLGRLPLIGPHDTLLFFALSLAVMGLFMSFSPILQGVRWFTSSIGITAGVITLAALRFKPLNMPLPQILDTLWFELHVVVAFFGYALFAIGGVVCVAYLLTGIRTYLDVYYKAALVGWTFFSA